MIPPACTQLYDHLNGVSICLYVRECNYVRVLCCRRLMHSMNCDIIFHAGSIVCRSVQSINILRWGALESVTQSHWVCMCTIIWYMQCIQHASIARMSREDISVHMIAIIVFRSHEKLTRQFTEKASEREEGRLRGKLTVHRTITEYVLCWVSHN